GKRWSPLLARLPAAGSRRLEQTLVQSAESMLFTNNSAHVSPQIVQDQICLIHENQARIQFQTKPNWIRIARLR
ncbi:unnamed protein product, partial [Musa acuminata var. zebrina]